MTEFAFDPDELFVPKGHNAPNWAWKQVTCVRCGTEFRCTPNSDYYATVRNTVPKDAKSGFCWDCMNIVQGLTAKRVEAGKDPQPEPPYQILRKG